MSSSSVAKDLGAINTSVASEILHFVQNDSCGDRHLFRWLPCVKGGSVILLHFAVCVNAVLRPTPKTLRSRISSTFGGFHFAVGEPPCARHHLAPDTEGVILERSEGSGRYHHLGGE